MKKLIAALTYLLFFISQAHAQQTSQLAFPTAEGFGRFALGGRGGRVIKVTNGNDSGPGSLRDCAETQSGPRTCVFDFSGTIDSATKDGKIHGIVIRNPYVTIAGQTSPGGVQMRFGGIWIRTHDVIIRHFKVRQGVQPAGIFDWNNDCEGIIVYGGEDFTGDIIVDHSEVDWGCDDSTGAYSGGDRVTFQWNINAEGMDCADYTQDGDCPASKGGFNAGGYGVVNVTSHHNLMAKLGSRLPLDGGAPVGAGAPTRHDFVNNVIYNWHACNGPATFGLPPAHPGTGDQAASDIWANVVGNKYFLYEDARGGYCPFLFGVAGTGTDTDTKLYVDDNWGPFCPNDDCTSDPWGSLPVFDYQWSYDNRDNGGPVADQGRFRAMTRFDYPLVNTTPLADVEAVVYANVGPRKPTIDSTTARIIAEAQCRCGGTNGGIGHGGEPGSLHGPNWDAWPDLATGAPPPRADTDDDGMPDVWETAHGLNPTDTSDGAAITASGYSNLEIYLNELAGDEEAPSPPSSPSSPSSPSQPDPTNPDDGTLICGTQNGGTEPTSGSAEAGGRRGNNFSGGIEGGCAEVAPPWALLTAAFLFRRRRR